MARRHTPEEKTPAISQSIANALVIKHDNLFFLTDSDGNVPLEGDHGFGLYHHDCRYLRGYELSFDGAAALVLASTVGEGFRALFELTNPELFCSDNRRIAREQLSLAWSRMVDADDRVLHDLLELSNHSQDTFRVPLRLRFRATFEDVFVVRGVSPPTGGTHHAPRWEGHDLCFAYDGADGLSRRLRIRFDPLPREQHEDGATFEFTLESRCSKSLRVLIYVEEGERRAPATRCAVEVAARRRTEDAQRWHRTHTTVSSDSLLLERIMARALEDLHILRTRYDSEAYFAAGIPWFCALFGRDSLVTSLQALAFNSAIAAETLRLLAKYQGKRDDPHRDEEPGRILHELRRGELTRIGAVPYSPYYGSVDSTPLFLVLLAEHAKWTGNLDLFRELEPNVRAALAWIDRDRGLPGFLAYERQAKGGLSNQGWKDSWNAMVQRDGAIAHPPIAPAEVQGYVYRAKCEIARLYARAGDRANATRLLSEARALRNRFERDYWLESEGLYAMALEAGNRPLAVASSNAGQTLWSGIARPQHARRLVGRLMQPDMFSGWGIRTLTTEAVRYNPVGYHVGCVWPHDNSLIALGFRRYCADDEALQIFRGMFEAATHFEHYRMPEVFTGFREHPFGEPVRYPVACHPQAWAAGSMPLLLQTLLGLQADAFAKRLFIVRPVLPDFISRIGLHALQVGKAFVDLEFKREGGLTTVSVGHQEGELEIRTLD